MADNKIKFLRGTSNEYAVAEKDNDAIYFTTDDGKLYIGNKEILGESIKALNSHINDSVKHITNTERTNWNAAKTHADSAHAPSNAQANVIESIKVNGTALTPSSKAVDITIPTVGNGTITITQNGSTKGTFTTNQSGNTTIALDDNNTIYTHPTSDGNKHVPANGTSNGGKYLKATATAGSYEWGNLTKSDVTTALGYTPPTTNTTYTAGTGLSLSGTKFNHSNSVTAGTAQGDASKTLTFGGTFTIPTVTYDAQGHITAKGTTTMTMPANPNTWRGIQNNLTSDSTTDSLSAAQGKVLKGLVDGKAAASHTHNYAGSSSAGGAATTALTCTGNSATASKLTSSSYTTISIATSDWSTNSSGGYVCTKTLSSAMAYTNFNIDVVLSTDQSAAKLQIEAWNNIIADGEITQTTSSGSTTAFTFYAFTNKPSVALTVGIQGVS